VGVQILCFASDFLPFFSGPVPSDSGPVPLSLCPFAQIFLGITRDLPSIYTSQTPKESKHK